MENEAIKLLALKNIKGYGNKRILDLISSYGSLDKIHPNFPLSDLINNQILEKYEKKLQDWKKNGIKILTYFDKLYPSNLKKISSPPLVLFGKGNLELLKMPSISIVGTRIASEKSLKWTYETSKELANLGYMIISGGALGVDASAHKGALDSTGNTICVLGSGLKNVYPKENLSLIEEIFKKGLVISEYLPDNHVNRISLLERNRITSGLGDKLLVVSTKLKGGAMSQYKVALSQKKDIFCPDPDLKLEPTEGIRYIIESNKNVKVINTVQEMLEFSKDNGRQKVIESFV